MLPLKAVAELCGLSWNTVKEIHKAGLSRKHRRSRFGGVRIIAIDEACVGRPRKYLTLVMDLESGEVLHIARGKGAAAPYSRPGLKRSMGRSDDSCLRPEDQEYLFLRNQDLVDARLERA